MGYVGKIFIFQHRAKTKEAGHEKSIIYVGLDVHKNSIEVAFADFGRDSEVRSYGKIDGSLDALDKFIRKLVSKNCKLILSTKPVLAVMRCIDI